MIMIEVSLTAPCIYWERARNKAASATSSTEPNLLKGIDSTNLFLDSCDFKRSI